MSQPLKLNHLPDIHADILTPQATIGIPIQRST